MVFCTYCGNSFTRDEHLERHILTHTNVKPFKCFTCHMSFARRDLLQRHYTVHGRTQSQPEIPTVNGMMPKTAGRTPIACTNCAKTKTKCDKKFPCSRCTARNLKCTIRPTRRSTKNAERLGLITAETIAKGFLPPDQTVAAEQIALPMDAAYAASLVPTEHHTAHRHDSATSSCCRSSSPSSDRHSVGADCIRDSALEASSASLTPPEFQSLSPTTPVHRGSLESGSLLANFDESMSSKLMAEEANPQFMLDWQQFQFPGNFDPSMHNDMFIQQDLGFDLSSMQYGPTLDPAFSMTADLTPGSMTASLMTPVQTPILERTFSSAQLADLSGQHSRNPSMISLNKLTIGSPHMQKADPVVAALDAWNVFRCVPDAQTTTCPLTARWNLEILESSLKNHDVWNSWTPDAEDGRADTDDALAVMQLHHSTRDKLLAITQGFLHKAMELHTESHDQRSFVPSSFILLPPTNILEYFLRSYTQGFECFFPVTSRGALDANELLHCHHDKASSLLVLLMVAQGALNTTSVEAKSLVAGLVETCRISLFDLVERNVHMATDHQVLHGALLFTSLAAWSGDKWQMDIAMGQRGIYTAMLRHSRMLEAQPPSAELMSPQSVDQNWNAWIQQENQSRLVYSWAMLDQELALFHDTAPLFSVTELGVPLPQHDALWKARSAGEWSIKMTELYGTVQNPLSIRPDSLRDLFRHFLDDDMQSASYPLTALHLRLLLHPLQSMVCHHTQLTSCFPASTTGRLDDMRALLQRWSTLATGYLKTNPSCAVMQASLALYHVIALNTVTAFDQIELLARADAWDGTYASLLWQQQRCLLGPRQAILHAGQVLRHTRRMARASRPAWWSAAVYRAGLVLWCDSLVNKDDAPAGPPLVVDALAPDHPSLVRYIAGEPGSPRLTARDGSHVPIDHGVAVLGYCIGLIGEGGGPVSRLQEGICAKLDRLMRS